MVHNCGTPCIFAIFEKPERGGGRSNAPPPAGRGLSIMVILYALFGWGVVSPERNPGYVPVLLRQRCDFFRFDITKLLSQMAEISNMHQFMLWRYSISLSQAIFHTIANINSHHVSRSAVAPQARNFAFWNHGTIKTAQLLYDVFHLGIAHFQH